MYRIWELRRDNNLILILVFGVCYTSIETVMKGRKFFKKNRSFQGNWLLAIWHWDKTIAQNTCNVFIFDPITPIKLKKTTTTDIWKRFADQIWRPCIEVIGIIQSAFDFSVVYAGCPAIILVDIGRVLYMHWIRWKTCREFGRQCATHQNFENLSSDLARKIATTKCLEASWVNRVWIV